MATFPASATAVESVSDTQRIVVKGVGKSKALTILLCEVIDPVAAARIFRTLLSVEGTPHLSFYDEPGPVDHRISVAVTYAGLLALRRPRAELATFPLEFRQGPVARAGIVNDVGVNAPQLWYEPFNKESNRVQVVFFVWDDDFPMRSSGRSDGLVEVPEGSGAASLHALVASSSSGLSVVTRLQARRRATEPFGFVDPVRQPVIIGLEKPNKQPSDPYRRARLGEFVLGERGDRRPEISRNAVPGLGEETSRVGYHGTYGALRIMRQHVQRADELERVCPGELSRIVGQLRAEPAQAKGSKAEVSGFDTGDYSDDPDGARCPIASHIRRANPLGGRLVNRSQARRWLLRRGVPYGYDERYANTGAPSQTVLPLGIDGPDSQSDEQGMVGLFLCASLADQYEGVLGEWLNRGLHDPRLTGTNDELIGLQQTESRQLVETRGVAYLFFPARGGIERLTDLSRGPS